MNRHWHFARPQLQTRVSEMRGKLHTTEATLAALMQTPDLSHSESAITEVQNNTAKSVAASTLKALGGSQRLVVLIGIGGSSLGTRAVWEALYPRGDASGKLIVLDTLDPFMMAQAVQKISELQIHQWTILLSSKSGSTLETLVNYNLLTEALVPYVTKEILASRTVVLTEEANTLTGEAKQKGIMVVPVPSAVSGRMSIFTTTGMVPLALLGVDTDAFITGAQDALRDLSRTDNATAYAACVWKALWEEGIRVREILVDDPTLSSLGQWLRQLLAESLGKTKIGFVPDVAVATIDYHSILQLRLDGPKHTASQYIFPTTIPEGATKTHTNFLHSGESFSVAEIRAAIREGVFASYRTCNISFETIEIPVMSAKSLGTFMCASIAETLYLGALFGVNPFDQPSVEAYKKTARHQLGII